MTSNYTKSNDITQAVWVNALISTRMAVLSQFYETKLNYLASLSPQGT